MNYNHGTQGVRIDRWLWAARFFKTRSLANTAVQGGHVHINGQRAKPSRQIHIADTIELHREPEHYELSVTALAEKRGSAAIAATLYQETEDSQKKRAKQAALRKAHYSNQDHTAKPDKKQRRQIIKFRKNI